jgi:hypothetical protein
MERHAKSYFLTVSKSDNIFKGYIYFVPYKFLEGFDETVTDDEYGKIMNSFHPDYLCKGEPVAEECFREKYEKFHNEFNDLLEKEMNLL